ncbi:MAG: hypothetical protein LBU48_06620, partial [Coriobacteriales bacterium]|nr:hypothetical protein [Coriobacteriales bacterium]
SFENVFRSGFKDGIKNFGELAFKTLVVDINDLKNWKAVPLDMVGPSKNWVVQGDHLIPSDSVIPGNKKLNPDGLTMKQIMSQEKFTDLGFPDTIPYKDGYPDLSKFSVFEADISMKNLDVNVNGFLNNDVSSLKFGDQLRDKNFAQARAALRSEMGMNQKALERQCGFKLTIHEDLKMKKAYFVPTEIHANTGHTGAISNYKFQVEKIPGLTNLLGGKTTQYGFRFGTESLAGALTGD